MTPAQLLVAFTAPYGWWAVTAACATMALAFSAALAVTLARVWRLVMGTPATFGPVLAAASAITLLSLLAGVVVEMGQVRGPL